MRFLGVIPFIKLQVKINVFAYYLCMCVRACVRACVRVCVCVLCHISGLSFYVTFVIFVIYVIFVCLSRHVCLDLVLER